MSEIFLKEQSPISRRFCIFHDDGESGWLYVTEPEGGKYVADAFAYNRVEPIPNSKVKEYTDGPPPICESHASMNAKIESPNSDQITFIWSVGGESVALLYRTVPIAMIIDAKKYGFSKGISVDGPWGHPWDQAIYNQHFAEHAGPQDAAKRHL